MGDHELELTAVSRLDNALTRLKQMARLRSMRHAVEAIVVGVTMVIGLVIATAGDASDATARVILLLAAAVASSGAALWLIGRWRGRAIVATCGLAIAAISPTGFAYIGNVLLLCLAAVAFVLDVRGASPGRF